MFLDLPKELQARIFDMLEADDRVRLNMALPAEYRIHRTVKTTPAKTRKLGMVAYMLKRTRPEKLTAGVAKLVLDNLDDPTGARIAREYGLVLGDNDSGVGSENGVLGVAKNIVYLLADVRSGRVCKRNAKLYPDVDELVRSMDIFDFVDALAEYGNGQLFDELYDLGYIAEPVLSDYPMVTRMFLNIVNFGNVEFLKYLVGRRGELVGIEDGCQYLVLELILDMFKDNLWTIDVLDDVIGIPDEKMKYLLATYLKDLNFEAADYFYRVKGVRL